MSTLREYAKRDQGDEDVASLCRDYQRIAPITQQHMRHTAKCRPAMAAKMERLLILTQAALKENTFQMGVHTKMA